MADSRSALGGAPSTALIVNLIAQIAFGLVAMTVCLPSMPDWGDAFWRPPDQVQLTFSGFVLTYGLMQLVYGPLSDRFGRRAMILIGLAVCVAGSVMAALAANLPMLVAARVGGVRLIDNAPWPGGVAGGAEGDGGGRVGT